MKDRELRLQKVHDRAFQILNTVNEHETVLGNNATLFKNIRYFAFAEHAAHDAVYNLPTTWDHVETPVTVSIFDADGMIRKYKVEQFLTDNPGIVGYILTGTDQNNARVHILFRGTKDAPSMQCDLETPAPGYRTFEKNKSVILAQLEATLERLNLSKINLSIGGHSLGGAYAQYCTHLLMQTMAKRDSDGIVSSLNKVKELQLFHLNSAGVDEKTCVESRMYAQYLSINTSLKLSTKILRVAGDPIQYGRNILSNLTANIVDTVLMKVNKGHAGWFDNTTMTGLFIVVTAIATVTPLAAVAALGTYATLSGKAGFNAHTVHHFKDKNTDEVPFEIFDNSTEEGQKIIAAKLSRESMAINGSFTDMAKAMIHSRTPSPQDPRMLSITPIRLEPNKLDVPADLDSLLSDVLRNKKTKIADLESEQKLQAINAARAKILKQALYCLTAASATLTAAYLLRTHNNTSTLNRSFMPAYTMTCAAALSFYTIYNTEDQRDLRFKPKPQ